MNQMTKKDDPAMNDIDTTREGIKVEPGQVWRDLDVRMGNRTRVVLKVRDGFALMGAADGTVRPTRVRVRRMHKSSTGWELVRSAREVMV